MNKVCDKGDLSNAIIEMADQSSSWKYLRVIDSDPHQECDKVLATLNICLRDPEVVTAVYNNFLSLNYTPLHHYDVVKNLQEFASSSGRRLMISTPTIFQNFNDIWVEIERLGNLFKNWKLGNVVPNNFIYEINTLKDIIKTLEETEETEETDDNKES